jgi:hypothetical protein
MILNKNLISLFYLFILEEKLEEKAEKKTSENSIIGNNLFWLFWKIQKSMKTVVL